MKKHQKAAIIGGIFLTIISIFPIIIALGVYGEGIIGPKIYFIFLLPVIGIGISIAVITYALSIEEDLCINCKYTIKEANLMRELLKKSLLFLEDLRYGIEQDEPLEKYEKIMEMELLYVINQIKKIFNEEEKFF
ncbi:MAG: hypothetical protein Q8M54_00400 [Desulfobaccales bacterium]|nr:hypothetical protein [Desulfobaccales bacterium]